MQEQESTKKDKLREEENQKEFKCSHCGAKFERTVQLSQHVRADHFEKTIKPNLENEH